MKIKVNILKSLILKLENELLFHESNTKFLAKRELDITEEYYVGLQIYRFLAEITEKAQSMEEVLALYQEFAKKKMPKSTRTFGDIFILNEDDSTIDNISYGLRICKDHKRNVPEIAREKIFQISKAQAAVGEKTIVTCLQMFEEFVSKILRILISSKPDAYFYDKAIKYSDLINKNIQTLTEEFIDKEVEGLMYDVSETIKKANKTHKLKLERYQEILDAYIEIDLRRNIIVHNGCMVNQKYLAGLPSSYPKRKIGEQLICDDVYVEKSIESLIKFAYLLYYLIVDDDEKLIEIAFEFLCSEKWELALFAYDLLLGTTPLSNVDRTMYQINRLNAEKHIVGLLSIKDEIEQLDVSGMENRFAIAKKMLLEEHSEASKMLNDTYPESFDFHMIQTWPLFIEYRKSEEYKEFIDSHQAEYAMYELREPEIQEDC